MNAREIGVLRFEESYFERIWGGRRLQTLFGKPLPDRAAIGEAWLIADHPLCESVVLNGPVRGMPLRKLIEGDSAGILGSRARLTPYGRFPLLLKLIDAEDILSVQVHPDDAIAARLGEPDAGKTEMWHVLHAKPGSQLYCGLRPDVTRETLAQAIASETLQPLLTHFKASEGMTVFVDAGTMHAIDSGLVIAEIQQNSNITYRCYDWGRVDGNGKPRDLHIEKSLAATHFGTSHGGPARTLTYEQSGAVIEVLGACRYFAGEALTVRRAFRRDTRRESFHMLMVKRGRIGLSAGNSGVSLGPGEAALLPGCQVCFDIEGDGEILDFYVPDLTRDIVAPLLKAGHGRDGIIRLGGDPVTSDLAALC